MVQSGNWLIPYYGYRPWFDKPPLFIWLTAALDHVFGVSEFAARVVSAVAGIAVVLLVHVLVKQVYDQLVGVVAALILNVSFHFPRAARQGMLDVLLTFFILLAIYGYVRLKAGRTYWWYLIVPAFALAIMTKSAAALVIPAVIAIALLFDPSRRATIRSRHFVFRALLASAIVAPWQVYMYKQNGNTFLEQYIGYRTVARAVTPLEGNAGNLFYYLGVLKDYFFPWFVQIPYALFVTIKEDVRRNVGVRTFLIFIAIVFILYTLVQTKLPWYIVPIYPALAIFIASLFIKAVRERNRIALASLVRGSICTALLAPLEGNAILGAVSLGIGLSIVASLSLLSLKRPLYPPLTTCLSAAFLLVGAVPTALLFTSNESPIAQLSKAAMSVDVSDRTPLIV